MKISLDLKKFGIAKKIKKHFSLVLWAFLGVLTLTVGWVVYGEVAKIRQLRTDAETVQKKMVRVDMDKHKKFEEALNRNASFIPETLPEIDAFVPIPPPEEES